MSLAESVNLIFGLLAVTAEAAVVLLIWFAVTRKPIWLGEVIHSHALVFAFIAVLLATLGSLTYSEILGYEPCKLCWIQRIFMYPQVLILGMVLWGRHRGSRALQDLALWLSGIGAVVALYHYLLQLGVAPALPCSAVGYSVSCAQRFVLQFGYITLPLMAFSAFLFVLLFLRLHRRMAA